MVNTHIVNTRLPIIPWWISLQDAESMYDEVDEVKNFHYPRRHLCPRLQAAKDIYTRSIIQVHSFQREEPNDNYPMHILMYGAAL